MMTSAALSVAAAFRYCGFPSLTSRGLGSAAAATAAVKAAAAHTPSNSGSRNREQRQHRLALFQEEQDRQRRQAASAATAIEVTHIGTDGVAKKLTMKQGVSTPMDVAKQVEELGDSAALALVNNSAWDMHRPLTGPCTVKLLPFKSPSSKEETLNLKTCNVALWRSGTMLLGSIFETAFKSEYTVKLVSYPPPFVPSGSFVYDCQVTKARFQHSLLQLNSRLAWTPGRAELGALSRAALPLLAADLPFEPLDLTLPAALEMFRHNDCKLEAARGIASAVSAAAAAAAPTAVVAQQQQQRQRQHPQPTVTVYRVGDFVDLSPGPMIASTGLIGRFLVAAVHQVESPDYGPVARVQGVALPRAFLTGGDSSGRLSADSLDSILQRGAVLNTGFLPSRPAGASAAVAR